MTITSKRPQVKKRSLTEKRETAGSLSRLGTFSLASRIWAHLSPPQGEKRKDNNPVLL
jgi:hypothetical protein